VNDAPVAVNDSAVLNEDGTVLIDVLANDTDAEGDTITITGFIQGSNGTVAQEGESLRFTPDAGYYGADSFTYDITDSNGGNATGTVNVTVNPGTLVSMDIDEATGQTDFIPVTITEAGQYEFKTSLYQMSCDTVIYLFSDALGNNMIASNDDYVDLYGCIVIDLDTGTYYVRIEEFGLAHLYAHFEVNKL